MEILRPSFQGVFNILLENEQYYDKEAKPQTKVSLLQNVLAPRKNSTS